MTHGYDSIEERCFLHGLTDDRMDATLLRDSGLALTAECCAQLRQLEDGILEAVQRNFELSNIDETVYTGGPGVAYFYIKAAIMRHQPELLASAAQHLDAWEDHQSTAAAEEPDLGLSLMCGQAGWLCVDALRHAASGDAASARRSAGAYAALAADRRARATLHADEWLYGRAGLLHGCFLLNHVCGPGTIPDSLIHAIALETLHRGIRRASREGRGGPPLMWKWSGKRYLGAAHGVMGILFTLLQVETVVGDPEKLQLVRDTLDWLLTQKTSSGNWPGVWGRTGDEKVHFCHGAPGAVALLCRAHAVFGDPRYLQEAQAAGDCVWQYGMVRKGSGLCHGFAGNAYAFLTLFRATRDPRWLLRAQTFANTMLREDIQRQCRGADNPLSLFEGLAGAGCFLLDLRLAPLLAAFPFYEVGGLSTPA